MTLLELIVVSAVIGALAAIAMQQFQLHRARDIDAAMRSDLKNAAMAMEAYYGEFLTYPSAESSILSIGYRKASGVARTINVPTPSTCTHSHRGQAARQSA